jgi:hypothetical protein
LESLPESRGFSLKFDKFEPQLTRIARVTGVTGRKGISETWMPLKP